MCGLSCVIGGAKPRNHSAEPRWSRAEIAFVAIRNFLPSYAEWPLLSWF